MAATAIISSVSVNKYSQGIQHVIGGNRAIEVAALVVFSLLGFPLAVSVHIYKSASLLYFSTWLVLRWLSSFCHADHIQCSFFCHGRVDCWYWWWARFVAAIHIFIVSYQFDVFPIIFYIRSLGLLAFRYYPGLAIGVLNLAIVVPQVISSVKLHCWYVKKKMVWLDRRIIPGVAKPCNATNYMRTL